MLRSRDVRASRSAARLSAEEPELSQIALDWDFERRCLRSLELDPPELLVERYIQDVSQRVERLEKAPLDERAQARAGLMVPNACCVAGKTSVGGYLGPASRDSRRVGPGCWHE